MTRVTHLRRLPVQETVAPAVSPVIHDDELLQRADVEFLSVEAPKAIAQSLDGVKRVSEIVAMKAFAHPSNTIELNMIVNAAHAIDAAAKSRSGEGTPTLGKITIRTRAADGHAEIDIEDTGSGMSEETLPERAISGKRLPDATRERQRSSPPHGPRSNG